MKNYKVTVIQDEERSTIIPANSKQDVADMIADVGRIFNIGIGSIRIEEADEN